MNLTENPLQKLKPKRLMIRLSSLGDVILATSALSAVAECSDEGENHWVVAKEFAGLFSGNPQLVRIWEYDRSQGGVLSWLRLCDDLWKENFTEVYDLHNTLRSRIAQLYFWMRGKMEKREFSWKTFSKERLKLTGFFIAKKLWPKTLRPTPLVERFSRLVGGTGQERPALNYLIQREVALPPEFLEWHERIDRYFCLMPSSKWDGKKWSVRGFFEVISKLGIPVLILGERSDRESVLLSKMLQQTGIEHFSGVGKLSFQQLAAILGGADFLLGNDTGLAHLSEAVGTPVVTVFGPTVPEMGFGPWRSESRTVGAKLWCRPCGKDGRYCLRLDDRYACLKRLNSDEVVREVQKLSSLAATPSSSSAANPLAGIPRV